MSHAAVDVVTMGEVMAALRAPAPLELQPDLSLSCAGAEGNVAIGLARLGHRVRHVGRVGDDPWGRLVRRTLAAEGVDAVLEVGEEPTGLITFVRQGPLTEVDYRRAGSAGAALTTALVDRALEGGRPRMGHLTGITPALGPAAQTAWRHLIARLQAADVPLVLDVNHRSRLASPEAARDMLTPVAFLADTVMGDDAELALAVPAHESDPAGHLIDLGVPVVVRKLGADGVEVITASDRTTVPARPVPVVDVVGAGDAFAAGYLSGRLDGLAPVAAAGRGVDVAAFVVAARGDWEHLPRRQQLTHDEEVHR